MVLLLLRGSGKSLTLSSHRGLVSSMEPNQHKKAKALGPACLSPEQKVIFVIWPPSRQCLRRGGCVYANLSPPSLFSPMGRKVK